MPNYVLFSFILSSLPVFPVASHNVWQTITYRRLIYEILKVKAESLNTVKQ